MDERVRCRMHERLDTILDSRAELEPAVPNALSALAGLPQPPSAIAPGAARELWRAVIALARDLMGDAVRAAAISRLYKDDSEQRKVLQAWLNDLWPLIHAPSSTILGRAPFRELSIFEVMDALSALDAGEIRPLFVANTGKNRRANRWSIARAKLEALMWKKRLRTLGYAEKAANFEVTKAFGEQWDTVRKWTAQCEQILGTEQVEALLDFAGSSRDLYTRKASSGGMLGSYRPDPLKSLELAGAAYRAEIQRSAELSKRKCRAAA
jgi:hypothetical protein